MGNNESHYDRIDTPKAPQFKDIFSKEALLHPCNHSANNCLAAKRICKILIEFYKFKRNESKYKTMGECIQELGSAYEYVALLNDYIHLLTKHNTNDAYEQLHNYFVSEMKTKCDLTNCDIFARYQRDRSTYTDYDNNNRIQLYETSDSNEIQTQQIIDKMHSYWVHTFDLGYKLTSTERSEIETNDQKYDDDNSLTSCADIKISQRKNIIKLKRNGLTFSENNRNTKWVLDKQTKLHRTTNDQKEEIYSFGFPYKYGKFHKHDKWYIPKRYPSLKIEITTNNTNCLSMEQFNDCYQKAQDYSLTNYCKKLKYLESTITKEHLLSAIVYCNADKLQKAFTETYRKADEKESDNDLITRHSNYANWGILLYATVNNFGEATKLSAFKKFYHGIDHEMTFQSTVAYFHGPLSTSVEYQVALVFATRTDQNGLIIELENLDRSPTAFFDCIWLSEYPYECEKLFIGGDFGLIIKNITNPVATENYRMYFKGFNIIQQMMRGGSLDEPITKSMEKFVFMLINHRLHQQISKSKCTIYKELPVYIQKSLNSYFSNVYDLTIDWRALHASFLKGLFINVKFDESFLDLTVISLLFPKLRTLTVTSIRLWRGTVESILHYCKQLQSNVTIDDQDTTMHTLISKSTLEEISIYRPCKYFDFELSRQEEMEEIKKRMQAKTFKHRHDNTIYGEGHFKGVETAVREYADKFSKYGWQLTKRSRFEMRILRL